MKSNAQLEAVRKVGREISTLDEVLSDDLQQKLHEYAQCKNISVIKALNYALNDWLDTFGAADSVVLPDDMAELLSGSVFMPLHNS